MAAMMKFIHRQTEAREGLDRGASMVEYIIALAILIVVFIAASTSLQTAATDRANFSMEVGNSMVPRATGPFAAYCASSADACK